MISSMITVPIAAMHAASGRESLEGRLRAEGAIDPKHAIALTPSGEAEIAGLEQSTALGTVVRIESGKLFLNPSAASAPSGPTAPTLLLILFVLASIIGSTVAVAVFAGK